MKLVHLLLPLAVLAISQPAFAAKKCSDFKTQQQAQAHHDSLKGAGKTGWKSLDRDGDGRACDCLPGGKGKNCPTKSKK